MQHDKTVIPAERYHRNRTCMIVQYGLQDLAPATQPAYFSITATVYRNASFNTDNRYYLMGGCLHEQIERCFKRKYTDLIKFHLRNEDGAPGYPLENGLYWAEIATGNSEWKVEQTPERATEIFAEHMFTDVNTAKEWLNSIFSSDDPATRRAYLSSLIEKQRPAWKAEARRLKTKYNIPDIKIFD